MDVSSNNLRGFYRAPTPIFLIVLASVVAFLLSTLSIAGIAAGRLVSTIDERLSGQVTVLVWGKGLESADAAAARASELLATQAGVNRSTVLEADQDDAIIAELVAGRSSVSAPPRLISMMGARSTPTGLALRHLLGTGHFVFMVDDHRQPYGPWEAKVLSAEGLSIGGGFVLLVSLFAASVVSGRKAMSLAHRRFDLMTRLGAEPAFIGGMVGSRLAVVVLAAAAVGTVCANLPLLLAGFGFELATNFGSLVQFRATDGVWTIAWPLVLAGTAALAANLSARRAFLDRERRL